MLIAVTAREVVGKDMYVRRNLMDERVYKVTKEAKITGTSAVNVKAGEGVLLLRSSDGVMLALKDTDYVFIVIDQGYAPLDEILENLDDFIRDYEDK